MVPQGALPTTIISSGTVTAKYTVTNNTPYSLRNIGLNYKPSGQTPIGVTQTTSGTNSPSTCDKPINLNAGASCTLVLTITGSDLDGGGAFGGPELCYESNTPSRCSVPAPGSQLNVTLERIVLTLSIAAGYDDSSHAPYLAQSNDMGSTWSSWTPPSGLPNTGEFFTTSCGSNVCIAAGGDDTVNEPMLAQTLDNGATWSMVALPGFIVNKREALGSRAAPKRIFSSACIGQECIGPGSEQTNGTIIYQTLNSGSSWQKITSGFNSNDDLFASACSTGLCVVGGNNSSLAPLIIQNPTGTANWAAADLSNITTTDGYVNGLACMTDYCVAVGTDSGAGGPMLVFTSDAGATPWSQYDLSSILSSVELQSAACASTICVSGGVGNPPPLITTTNGGSNWSAVDLSSIISGSGGLSGASCSTDICVLIGADTSTVPVLIQSIDTGGTWTAVDLATEFSISIGELHAINCQGTYCVAAGLDDSTSSKVPFLIQTVNKGANWTLVSPTGVPAHGAYNGAVAAISKLWNDVKRRF
jgi:hypothetical protein